MKLKRTQKLLLVAALFGGSSVLWCGSSSDQTAVAQSQKKGSATKPAQTEEFPPGIAVGQTLPEINLKNQLGESVSLKDVYSKQPVALVLYRSADW